MEKRELNWAVIGCGVIANEMAKLRKEWGDRKSTRLNSSHSAKSRMPSSA